MKDQAANLRILAEESRESKFVSISDSQMWIAVGSGKGGVGKSFISLNLAHALASTNEKVLLIDGNFRNPNLHIMTNSDPAYSVNHFLKESLLIKKDALINIGDNLDLLGNTAETDSRNRYNPENAEFFMDLIAPLAAEYSYVIMDLQTGLNQWNLAFFTAAHAALLVTVTDPTSIIDTYILIKAILPFSSNLELQLVLNQVIGKDAGNEAHQNLNLALQHFLQYEIPLQSVISFDMKVRDSFSSQKPLWNLSQNSTSLNQIKQMAQNLSLQRNKMLSNRNVFEEVFE